MGASAKDIRVLQRRKRRTLYRCGRKVGYPTKANAAQDAERLRARSTGAHVEPYHCARCGGYHNGPPPNTERRRPGRRPKEVR